MAMRFRGKPLSRAVVYLAAMIAAMVGAQVLFKAAGNYTVGRIGIMNTFLLNPWLWGGLCLSGVGMICWLLTLRRLPLTTAYPWTALIYVLTPASSAVLFGETLTAHYLAGLCLIVTGVLLTAGRAAPP